MAKRPRRYSDDQLRQAVAGSRTMSDVLRALDLVPRGGNYENVRAHIERLGLTVPSRGPRRGRSVGSVPVAELAEAVRVSRSAAEVAAALGITPGSVGRVAARIRALGFDTSHFRGQGWRRGSTTPVVRARPLAELLVADRLCQTNTLKQRLILEGLKEPQCEGCLLYEWCGEPIPLELDHVNGDRRDNRLGNLRLLCPNCHALTPTYRGRNIGR
jgi:hypothetical protein